MIKVNDSIEKNGVENIHNNSQIQNIEIRANEFGIPANLRSELKTPALGNMISGLETKRPDSSTRI